MARPRREDLMSDIFRAEKEMLQTEFTLSSSQRFSFPAIGHLFQWSNPFRTLNYHGTRQPALLVIWTLLFIGYFPSKFLNYNLIKFLLTSDLSFFAASMQTEQVGQGEPWPLDRNDPDCSTCARERAVSVLKEDEVKRWRIETIKQQILDRLEMEDRPPRVKTKSNLIHSLPPTVVLPESSQIMEIERTRQIILFPTKIFRRNKIHHDQLQGETLTIKFPITDEMSRSKLKLAVLWTAQATSDANSTASGKIVLP